MADSRLRERSIINERGCWIWQGAKGRAGYGSITIGSRSDGTRRNITTHRYSYEQHSGPVPEGMLVCHRCDNPSCVNPGHLFLGTDADNMRDKVEKRRHARRDDHGRAKLTSEQVIQVRHDLAAGARQVDVASKFGVVQSVISAIKQGLIWKEEGPDNRCNN
jgi:hypothetical protein